MTIRTILAGRVQLTLRQLGASAFVLAQDRNEPSSVRLQYNPPYQQSKYFAQLNAQKAGIWHGTNEGIDKPLMRVVLDVDTWGGNR